MKYTSLFFDLDNTLLDFNMAEQVAVRKVLRLHGLPFDDEAVAYYHAVNRNYWERFERGEIPKSDIFEGRFKTFMQKYGKQGDTAAISKEYCSYLAEGHYVIDGALEILGYLKEKGYKIYATTNGFPFTQCRRIKESGLEPYFDGVFISEEAKHQKPEREYFEYVISNIKEKEKKNILVIGDSQSSDILGGINAGLDTCWYNPEGLSAKYKSDYEISVLAELKKIL